MTSKEKLALIKETWYDVDLTDEKYSDFDEEQTFNDLEKDLEVLEAIKNKAQNNRFFRGCLLRMFCEIKKTPDGAFTKKEKIKDENYEKIMRWLDEKD